jgi:hypothetical protein
MNRDHSNAAADEPQTDAEPRPLRLVERSPSPCPACGVDIWEPRHFSKHLPERYRGPPKRRPRGERSVIDALCEGDFDHLPDDAQEHLRVIANHRFFPTVKAQWVAAAEVLREWRDG